jgi:hypothetical protein
MRRVDDNSNLNARVMAEAHATLSALADQARVCTTALQPLHAMIERHVLAAERLNGDDMTVPILAEGKTLTWAYLTHRRRRSITPQ